MKKLFLLVTGLLIVSCSNDDEATSAQNNQLSSITALSHDEQSGTTYEKKLSFYKGKLMNSQDSYGFREDYSYQNNLVSKISNSISTRLTSKIAYTYDSKGRIITLSKTFITEDQERVNLYYFTYTGSKILVRFGTPEARILTELTVDANNNITSERYFDENGTIDHECTFVYTNGNLTSYTDNSLAATPITRNYTYTTLLNNSNYHQFLYGKEWKMNYSLHNYVSGKSMAYTMEAVSKNLPSGFTQDNNGIRVHEATIEYVLNDQNRIVKENRLIQTPNNLPLKEEFNYNYQ